MELKVWERIDDPNKTIDEKLADVADILKHIDEKTPKGVWSREVEVKGCWLDIQESLENIRDMGDKNYLEFNCGTDEEPKIGRMPRSMCEERIQYKLETYYDTKSMEEAMEIERDTPPTKARGKEKSIDR